MKIINTPAEWLEIEKSINRKEKHQSIGLVPTMGALHKGHLSLVERAINENDISVVSIFLNPVQFNNQNDLKTYPKTWEEDCTLLEKAGVDYLFAPTYDIMYPDDYHYKLSEDSFSKTLCGASRPGHFDGVLTVVMKLFQIFLPEKAYFGEKDFQQYKLLDGMAKAFFLRTEIIPCPIVREENGLAFSSRNKRLSEAGLAKAPCLHKALASGKSVDEIKAQLEADGFMIDYVTEVGNRLYAAASIEDVRLIDNVER